MDEGRQLLESFARHEMPDLWPDIQERSLGVEMVAESPRGTIPPPLRGPSDSFSGSSRSLSPSRCSASSLCGRRARGHVTRSNRTFVWSCSRWEHNEITARITDPLAAASQLSAVFERRGLNITVGAIPVSPSLVGTIVYSDVPSTRSLHEGTGLGGGTSCEVGSVISSRLPRSGERRGGTSCIGE